jgi:Proliferating cell nuclear antigen, C-terminal domain
VVHFQSAVQISLIQISVTLLQGHDYCDHETRHAWDDTDYNVRITMASPEFTRIVRDLSTLGESYISRCPRKGFALRVTAKPLKGTFS